MGYFFGVYMFPTSTSWTQPQEVFRHDVLNRSDVHQVSRLGLSSLLGCPRKLVSG